jgi:hypothetical protein
MKQKPEQEQELLRCADLLCKNLYCLVNYLCIFLWCMLIICQSPKHYETKTRKGTRNKNLLRCAAKLCENLYCCLVNYWLDDADAIPVNQTIV